MATLFLIPTPISKGDYSSVFPEANKSIVSEIDHFLVENLQSGISFLKWMGHPKQDFQLHFDILDKRTSPESVHDLMEPMRSGKNMGVLTDAGMPGIADPGNLAVRWAHANNHKVSCLIGPSSLFLALAASGLNGQNFHFVGYVPRDEEPRSKRIKELEVLSAQEGATILFIEAPQRNLAVFQALLENLNDESVISIAQNITGDDEIILTKTVSQWKTEEVPLKTSEPVIFLFQAIKIVRSFSPKKKSRQSKRGKR